jgi:tetratricopeptide (TPR) repeat protein
MLECSHPEIGKKIHAYELGLLDGDELDQFETHLLECDYCYNEVVKFRTPAHIILTDQKIISDVRNSINGKASEGITDISEMRRRKRRNNILKVLAAAAIIAFVLIINPWKIEFNPVQQAVAQEDIIAIMYFENLADTNDSMRLGEIASNLLITDLSESHYVRVLSDQRLYDILKQLGHAGEKKIDRSTASQVADKADARWMLMGSIVQAEPVIILTSQLVDMETGEVLASQRVDGDRGDKIFSLIDRLSLEIKNDLSLPEEAYTEPDPQVANVTTSSLDGYRYYLEGMEYRFKYYGPEAANSFRKAIEYDSTFAMAYFWLVDYTFGEEQEHYKNLAIKYSENAGRKEKLYISVLDSYCREDWDEYLEICEDIVNEYPDEKMVYWSMAVINHRNLARPDKAINYLNKAIELDPYYRIAYDALAYAYEDLGEFEKSIQAIDRYIEIAPHEANPYETRADLYAYHGNIRGAIESYKKALEIKPDYSAASLKLGIVYLFEQEYKKADSIFQIIASNQNKEGRTVGRCYLARIPLYQGKFRETLRLLDAFIEVDYIERENNRFATENLFLKAFIYAYHLNDIDSAVKYFNEARSLRESIHSEGNLEYWEIPYMLEYKDNHILAYYYAHNGYHDTAKTIINSIYAEIDKTDSLALRKYWNALALLESEKGNYDSALAIIGKYPAPDSNFMNLLLQANIYYKADQLDDAIKLYEKLLIKYDAYRAWNTSFSVLLHYWAGLAYEKARMNEEAIEQYKTFLDIWKNADPGIEEVEDARIRLKRLTIQT